VEHLVGDSGFGWIAVSSANVVSASRSAASWSLATARSPVASLPALIALLNSLANDGAATSAGRVPVRSFDTTALRSVPWATSWITLSK
jgi:hypothetical protein